jgi:methylmalonyl-CoA/ethylmalonyl-CoA epimerase
VLVCPDDPDSVPGRHLAEHGEGLFLLSVGTDRLEGAADIRQGIDDWVVADVGHAGSAVLQLCDDSRR